MISIIAICLAGAAIVGLAVLLAGRWTDRFLRNGSRTYGEQAS